MRVKGRLLHHAGCFYFISFMTTRGQQVLLFFFFRTNLKRSKNVCVVRVRPHQCLVEECQLLQQFVHSELDWRRVA